MRRPWLTLPAAHAAVLLTAAPALACGGLIGPNGAVNLLRTTTFAGYHDGVEHYVTSFEFAGGGGAFGSITPLPGIPTEVVRGGDWTLQRLVLETDPPELVVPRGVPITFVLVNEDPIDHEWLIGDAAFHAAHRIGTHASHGTAPTEVTVPALETAETTITFDEPGTLAYICHLPGHEAYGMVGVLTVEG